MTEPNIPPVTGEDVARAAEAIAAAQTHINNAVKSIFFNMLVILDYIDKLEKH